MICVSRYSVKLKGLHTFLSNFYKNLREQFTTFVWPDDKYTDNIFHRALEIFCRNFMRKLSPWSLGTLTKKTFFKFKEMST